MKRYPIADAGGVAHCQTHLQVFIIQLFRFLSGGETAFQSKQEHRYQTVSPCSQFDIIHFPVLL